MSEKNALVILKQKYQHLSGYLDEKTLRIWAATEALVLGRGGISFVARTIGISRTTLYVGIQELKQKSHDKQGLSQGKRIRRPGGGRKKLKDIDKALLEDLESLLEPMTRGDPTSALRWTCKSTTKLANELKVLNHQVSQRTICSLLADLGYSLQSNRKTREGLSHPDRNAQFLHISEMVKQFQKQEQPVISVDTKKKEIIGEFKNNGREWCKKGKPTEVNIHDFADSTLGKVVPYGIYDVLANKGWVNVGIDHNTAQFAVESIRRWWHEMGKPVYPQATDILVTADCGGSNGNRVRLWKFELQKLADELGMTIHVCHLPPGTSKWNKIEHRMFCYISQNWRGRPLTSREVIVNLISSTTTKKGLKIKAAVDQNQYPTGIKVTNKDFRSIAIERSSFHGEWNYKIKCRK
jgi:hypothetical protein